MRCRASQLAEHSPGCHIGPPRDGPPCRRQGIAVDGAAFTRYTGGPRRTRMLVDTTQEREGR